MEQYLYDDLYLLEETHWWHKIKRHLAIKWLKYYLEAENPKILDIGCGTGKNVEAYNSLGSAWGIDVSPYAVKYCKKRGLKNIKLGSSDKTGFNNNTFDAISMLDLLEHTDELATLQECYRILKPCGIIIINVPAFSWLWSRWDEVLFHKKRYTRHQLHTVLNRTGFRVLKSSYWFWYLVLPVYIIRKVKSILFPKFYPSDFRLSHPLINIVMYQIALIEAAVLQNFSLPVGTSLICVAQKKRSLNLFNLTNGYAKYRLPTEKRHE